MLNAKEKQKLASDKNLARLSLRILNPTPEIKL